MWTKLYFTPCPVPSCPAYEPNSNFREYSQPFLHIQYKRTPSFRPIATLANLQRKDYQGLTWHFQEH
jgi:hypothetical protein